MAPIQYVIVLCFMFFYVLFHLPDVVYFHLHLQLHYLRVARSQSLLEIIADPSSSVNKKREIELSVNNANTFTGSGYKKKWKCSKCLAFLIIVLLLIQN